MHIGKLSGVKDRPIGTVQQLASLNNCLHSNTITNNLRNSLRVYIDKNKIYMLFTLSICYLKKTQPLVYECSIRVFEEHPDCFIRGVRQSLA